MPKKKQSPGIRFAYWLNENEGTDFNHAARKRVAKKFSAMARATKQRKKP